jgi:hypothetical protein
MKLSKKRALALAVAIWGEDAAIKDLGPKWTSSPEKRANARDEFLHLKENQPTMKQLLEWPDDTPLREYKVAVAQQKEAYNRWREAKDNAQSRMHTHRYSVGTLGKLFFTVLGVGDSWEECFTYAGYDLYGDRLPKPSPALAGRT